MTKYKFIKDFLANNNKLNDIQFSELIQDQELNFDNDLKLVLLLCHNHYRSFYSLIIKYLPDNTSNYSYIYFRFFYYFYILIKFAYCEIKPKNIKFIFMYFLKYTRKINYNKNRELYDKIVNRFIKNYDYLYDTFFVKDNIYFNVYFNNLIKYFLPLPHEYLLYTQIITYRNNVKHFYKKNDNDDIEIISTHDFQQRLTGEKNINSIRNEMDIHIPLKYFNNCKLKNNVYLIIYKFNKAHILLIANSVIKIKENNKDFFIIKNIKYTREFYNFNNYKFNIGYPLQLLFKKWKTEHDSNKKINQSDITYISIMRKIIPNELFNVFSPINFKTDNYKYLFHNTSYEINDNNINHILTNPTFFYFIPHGSKSYATSYFKNRKCDIFKLNKNMTNILDLTQSISNDNPFINSDNLKLEHQKQKLWKAYDLTKILNYYDDKEIPFTINDNYKCITTNQNININDFVKQRPYCDIGNKKLYVGRRKLYEILFKTRKYDASAIWPMEYLADSYNKQKIKVSDFDYVDPMYNNPEKIKAHVTGYLYDIILLKLMGYSGFFFTDFDVAISHGGELMLTNAKDFINLYKYSLDTCDKKVKFNEFANHKNIQ